MTTLKLQVIQGSQTQRSYLINYDETEGNVMLLTIGDHEYLVDINGLVLHENTHDDGS